MILTRPRSLTTLYDQILRQVTRQIEANSSTYLLNRRMSTSEKLPFEEQIVLDSPTEETSVKEITTSEVSITPDSPISPEMPSTSSSSSSSIPITQVVPIIPTMPIPPTTKGKKTRFIVKIKDLRKKAKDQLGPLFDSDDFHTIVLDNNSVPEHVLENVINEWINRVKSSDTLQKISSDFWEWRMVYSREFSTQVGQYKYNDKLDSYSYDKLLEAKKVADGFLQRVGWINREALNKERKIAYDVLKNILETFIAGYKWKDYMSLNPINFMEGWFVGLDLFISGTPFDTEGDFINYIRRIENIPRQLEEMMDLTRRAIAYGLTSHEVAVSRVPDNIESFVTDTAEESELFTPFTEHGEKAFGKRANDAKVRLIEAIDAANAKFNEVKDFINEEYMPYTRKGLGIGSLPNGLKNYEACLYFHTSVKMSAEQIHEQGLEEVDRIAKLIRQKMTNLGFPETMKISEMYQQLGEDEKFIINDPDDALDKFKEIIYERIQPEISKYFKNVPDLPLEIRPLASDGVGGEYWAGTADGSRSGIFYVNLHKPEYNPTFKMVSLSLHEAIPGHHMAESYGLLADIPAFMKNFEWRCFGAPYFFPFHNSFSEGWALYAEFLGEEMGMYQTDYEMLGRYADEMLRAVRLVVDTGIHHFDWTREEAIDYMLDYTAETPDSAAVEVDRYATLPGQACGYKVGELKIKELRRRATERLGPKFDIRDFHYTVLRYGALPLDVLENVVEDWINEVEEDDSNVDGGKGGAYDKIGRMEDRQCSHSACASNESESFFDKMVQFNDNISHSAFHRDNLWEVPLLAAFMFAMYFMNVYNTMMTT